MGRNHLLSRLQHGDLLIGHAGLGLDDIRLGHAAGLDQGAVGLQQGSRARQRLFRKPDLLLRLDQAPIGDDDGTDGPGDRRLQLQTVDLFLQAGDANGGHVDGRPSPPEQRLVQTDPRRFIFRTAALQRVCASPDELNHSTQRRAPGRRRADDSLAAGLVVPAALHHFDADLASRHESTFGHTQVETLNYPLQIGRSNASVIAQG
ncbi:hypothetical protein D3C87_1427250 [compost metagenome]